MVSFHSSFRIIPGLLTLWERQTVKQMLPCYFHLNTSKLEIYILCTMHVPIHVQAHSTLHH